MSTLVKPNGFPSIRSLMEDFWSTDKFFNQPFLKAELPAVNIRDTDKNYEIEVAVPGFKKNDFKVTTENGRLTISAETSNETNEEKENYTRKEFSRSSFTRSFTLPDNVVEDNITAQYQDGLLKIDLQKAGKSLTAKKEVKVA
ncbi:Hsp20/alpha crystallin family protein [Mucilaginibacter sp. RS28]|uniref:Hsp20/alpha crystallin family protein n=1 Tax=Mucilaginibacter straminoryzae TaxID=2932774 RepID=A0A9X1X0F2_9SPHI|nr:Hsp20/alpha crystallin family protein [Mucilaginibacter straminoryzae]MCJ8208341.1 Hsp20/alpha crystallin family protein [Mucilaginibacter straminoryzae]